MPKIKYKVGDRIGPSQLILLKRVKKNKKWYGEFECPYCHSLFQTRLDRAVDCKDLDCGCQFLEKSRINGGKFYIDIAGQRFGKLVALYPTNPGDGKQMKWHCRCDCGNYADVTGDHLRTFHTTSCGKCRVSRGEVIIKNFLTQLNIKFEQQKTFPDCVNPKTGRLLRFDFYLPEKNLCLEYDGQQHFTGWFQEDNVSKSLEEYQYRDSLKNDYCKQKGITLVRVPYLDYSQLSFAYLCKKIGVYRQYSHGIESPPSESNNVINEYKGNTSAEIRKLLEPCRSDFVSILYNVDHDLNIGTTIRSNNAFLGKDIYIFGRRRFDTRGAVGTNHIEDVYYVEDIKKLFIDLKSQQYTIIAVDNSFDTATNLFDYEMPKKVAFVYGNEKDGIPQEVIALCDDMIYVRQEGSVRSMNVACCASVIMYEYTRQWRNK